MYIAISYQIMAFQRGYFPLEIGQIQQSPLKNQKSQQDRGLSINYDVSVGRDGGQK